MASKSLIGNLPHRIEIYAPVETREATTGQVVVTWPTLTATRWASITPVGGQGAQANQEAFAARQVYPEATHRIRLRYFEGLTVQHRLKYGARTFDVAAVLDIDERRIAMDVVAVERM